MSSRCRRRSTVAGGERFRGEGLVLELAAQTTAQRLRREAIVGAGARKRRDGGLTLRGLGSRESVDELDVEGFDGAEGPGVGLPVEVAEREAGD